MSEKNNKSESLKQKPKQQPKKAIKQQPKKAVKQQPKKAPKQQPKKAPKQHSSNKSNGKENKVIVEILPSEKENNEELYSSKLKHLLYKIKNQNNYNDAGIRFAWKH